MGNGGAAIAKVGLNALVDKEIFVLAVQVRTIGDTPLINHEVRILDPDTGEMVGSPVMTDDDGVVRALVPENKTYRIEIADEEHGFPELELHPDELAVLLCHFVDEAGAPLANRKVDVSQGNEKFELATDEAGKIEAAAHLGHYELKIDDQVFHAHALLMKDRERDENIYRFVVEPDAGSDDQAGWEPKYNDTLFEEEEASA